MLTWSAETVYQTDEVYRPFPMNENGLLPIRFLIGSHYRKLLVLARRDLRAFGLHTEGVDAQLNNWHAAIAN
jgi:hypothetical protein